MCSLPPVEYNEIGGKVCTLRVTLSQTSEKGNIMSVGSLVVCTLRRVCSPTVAKFSINRDATNATTAEHVQHVAQEPDLEDLCGGEDLQPVQLEHLARV